MLFLIAFAQVLLMFKAPELISKPATQIIGFEVFFKLLRVLRRIGDNARIAKYLE